MKGKWLAQKQVHRWSHCTLWVEVVQEIFLEEAALGEGRAS